MRAASLKRLKGPGFVTTAKWLKDRYSSVPEREAVPVTLVDSGMTQDELYAFLGLEKPTNVHPPGTVTVTKIDRASGTITVSVKQ